MFKGTVMPNAFSKRRIRKIKMNILEIKLDGLKERRGSERDVWKLEQLVRKNDEEVNDQNIY